MGLKEKLKSTGKVIIISALGFVGAANMYTVVNFQKHIDYIEENPGSFGSISDRYLFAKIYLRENKKFPNNILTFLSRQDAKGFIEQINNLYH